MFEIANAAPDYWELLSSEAGKRSFESEVLKHGFFTFALLEVLGNALLYDPNNQDAVAECKEIFEKNKKKGGVSFQRLYDFAFKRVPRLVNKLKGTQSINQTPSRPRSLTERQDDIRFFILKNKR